MRKVLIIAGTRPEVIKLAPVVLRARESYSDQIRIELCLTGQHQTMADEALSIFGIKEDHNLRIMSPNQTINDVARMVFERLPQVLQTVNPDVVMVQGDTTTASMSALCAFNMRVPIAHVEAGLRSHDLAAPFPEEMNRKMITSAARYNFCPTESTRRNLIRESIPEETITVTGNTVVDALRLITERHDLDGLAAIHHSIRNPFVLVTAHRRESFGTGIEHITEALKKCAQRFPDHQFVYPVHLNPNINNPVRERLRGIENIILLQPVSYLALLTLLKHCVLVISDSGGIQEEAPSFNKYCMVLRDVTERRESVDFGLSELVGTDPGCIVDAVTKKLEAPSASPSLPNPYGDGHAAERILETLASHQELP
jgi:UDP-N-acetylglucosamine 2-epimerase (non-hydrolysing)